MRTVDPRSMPGRLRDLGMRLLRANLRGRQPSPACTFLGEATHDVAAGAIIATEAGCTFGTINGRILTPAEFVAQTPVTVPTFIAAPKRRAALMRIAKLLDGEKAT